MKILIFGLFLGLSVVMSAEEIKYTEKDFAVDIFGQEQSEPINTGFFFHDGKYVPPPYVVKRLGLSVFINDIMVHVPVPYPLHRVIPDKLPEIPKNITKESKADDIVRFMTETFDYYFPKYFSDNEPIGQEKLDLFIAQIHKLPCVKKIISGNDKMGLAVHLHNGEKFAYDWERFPDRSAGVGDPIESVKKLYQDSYNQKIKSLTNENLLGATRRYIPVDIRNPEEIYSLLKILNSDEGDSRKAKQLQAFNFSNEDKVISLLIQNYQYSEDLTKRVEALYEAWKKSPKGGHTPTFDFEDGE
jgi:hypothetical protein